MKAIVILCILVAAVSAAPSHHQHTQPEAPQEPQQQEQEQPQPASSDEIILPATEEQNLPEPVEEDYPPSMYIDVPREDEQYGYIVNDTTRALNFGSPDENGQTTTTSTLAGSQAYRLIIEVLSVKKVQNLADAGINKVVVTVVTTNCTVDPVTDGNRDFSACVIDSSLPQEECVVKLQYNYYPLPNAIVGPWSKVNCMALSSS